MLVSADVKCYYCGYVSGEVVADTALSRRILAFKPAAAAADRPADARRCGRCGGPVFLDEAQTLTIGEARALLGAARRQPPARATSVGA